MTSEEHNIIDDMETIRKKIEIMNKKMDKHIMREKIFRSIYMFIVILSVLIVISIIVLLICANKNN